MTTITEDYVSFETAKLSKEKGLKVDDETCRRWAVNKQLYEEGHFNESNAAGDYIPIPTIQVAMKWLRNTFHFEIYPFHDAIQENNNWWYRIEHHSKGCSLTEHESDAIYKTYEEACDSAIRYCLENLI